MQEEVQQGKPIQLEGLKVFVGMPAHRPIPVPTVLSALATMAACTQNGVKVNFAIPYAASVVTSARNHVAHLFLKSDYDYLFWIDSDMEWRAQDFLRVLAMTTVKDVVRVAYPARQDPLIFDFDGLGFTCVSRKVMVALAAQRPTIFYGDHAPCAEIFYEAKCKSKVAADAGSEYEFLAEDTSFFHDIRRLGFGTWVDPEIELGHIGEKMYKGSVKNDGTPDNCAWLAVAKEDAKADG